MKILKVPILSVVPWDKNPRGIRPEDLERLKHQILKLGVYKPLVCYQAGKKYVVLGGNMRIRALMELGAREVEISLVAPKTEAERIEFALSDNDRVGYYEEKLLAELLQPYTAQLRLEDFKVDIGESLDLRSMLDKFNLDIVDAEDAAAASLAERFVIPPLSVFDTRQGYWQERKRAWVNLGIESEASREGTKTSGSLSGSVPGYYAKKKATESKLDRKLTHEEFAEKHLPGLLSKDSLLHYTDGGGILSMFDPVLCEIVYRWFCPPKGSILDPFAGGSVRGIVASLLGYGYAGVDLRKEQVEANRLQGAKLCKGKPAPRWVIGNSLQIDKMAPGEHDLLFSCPPYFDLERYSDDPADLSCLNWDEFREQYAEIIRKSCGMLRDNRFACFVVGEIRDKAGLYRNFIDETKRAFLAAGLSFYNDIILVNAIGSAPIRVGKPFSQYRKVGKVHQNVLVFYKGKNPRDIKKAFSETILEGGSE